ncbi:glycosyltransferase family 9 protein [Phenylobacterium sp.]|uniref:glycosyltransferase family 9 protein n=1 Tax=Phenylobacterium sp. TaxID=1871053 RepID=UPI002733BE76|nr:glycosyltransferase family 9 protein [Phenylobacterium sp.]MDP3172941.1 glycosyltransferase family 9 protein [Phenylobacterium sp.]MDP3658979.1 glycosyltransferase family 9 protein [Phenylobacterium sp.]
MAPVIQPQILVIKLGDLESFVQSLGAMQAIREAHRDARITLLTSTPFEPLAKASPYFNAVELDSGGGFATGMRLRASRFSRVYDLEGGGGSAQIRLGLWPGPTWLRSAPTTDGETPPPDLSWILQKTAPERASSSGQRKPYVLFIPGGGSKKPQDRWPGERFGELGKLLHDRGFDIVVVGAPQDANLARDIQRKVGAARDLTGASDYARMAALCARAALVVGGTHEAMHLAAAVGAPTIVVLPRSADPAKAAPRGHVTVLQADVLAELPAATVAQAANTLTPAPARGA